MTKPTQRHRSSSHFAGRLVLIVVVLATSLAFGGSRRASAWDFVYGDAGPDNYSRYMDVALAPDGSSYVAGFYSGDFRGLSSPAAYRYFIERLTPSGVVAWTKEVPTAALSTFALPKRPQVVVDGLGNVVVEAVDSLYSFAPDGSLVASVVLPPQGPAGDAGAGGNMAAVATGGIVVTSDRAQKVRRYSPALDLLWTFDATPYVDDFTKAGVVAQPDGTFWFVGNKFRTLPTQSDATALVHIAANGTKIAAIKQFGFLTENMTGPNPILGASDNWIVVTGYTPNAGGYQLKVFSTVDGRYLGEFPSRHPSHPFATAAGTADCSGTDLVFEDRLDPTAAGDYNRTTMRRVVMNGTRLISLAYCSVAGRTMPAPFMISYAIGAVGANALTFITARELTGATTMEGMSANDLGDQVVVGSSTSSVVYVGAPRSLPEVVSTQQRALAAKNPVGSLFYGLRLPGSVLEVKVGGRLGVPVNARGVTLNITAVGAKKPGILKAFPCGVKAGSAVAVTYPAGATVATSATTSLGRDGKVCIYTTQATHLTVDIGGHFPAASPFIGRNPGRFLDTRAGVSDTFDAQYSKLGRRVAGSTTAVPVVGRGGIPTNATSVTVALHVFAPSTAGGVSVFPCGAAAPTSPTMTFTANQTRTTSAVVKVGSGGRVCLRTTAAADLALDVSGHFVPNANVLAQPNRRLLDTRPTSASTVDGRYWRIGERLAKSTSTLQVSGRGGIPSNATAAALQVTVASPRTAGSLTVYPCGTTLPNTPNLVFAAGQTVTVAVVARLGTGGTVCLYTTATTQIAADATIHFLGTTAFNGLPKPFRMLDTRRR